MQSALEQRLPGIVDAIRRVIRGKDEVVTQAVTALIAGGHLLIEDVPGVGKTTLGKTMARAIGGIFHRVQFTSDLLPADILGVNLFDATSQEFRFRPGPIFCHVLLADEINRTTPRTQSALLQAMEERHVTLDGTTHALPSPFFVIATQNPLEHHGTYPLPESQMDRFMMRISMGYPEREAEREMIAGQADDEIDSLDAVISTAELQQARERAQRVHIDESLVDYLMRIVEGTREHPELSLGASPRASLALGRAARASAYLDGREFVVPDDIKGMAGAVLSHRLLPRDPTADAQADRTQVTAVLARVLGQVRVPL